MMTRFSRLQILQNQIDCRNRLNAEVEKFRVQLNEVFKQFIGKKIYKFTGNSLCAAVSKLVAPIEEEARAAGFSCWFEITYSSIYFNLQSRYDTSTESVDYCKSEFFVAAFDRGTGLMTEETRSLTKLRCDYTLEEITTTRDKIAELEKQISSLKSSIAEFARGYY